MSQHRVLDVYTSHIPLTQKARFWSDFVSSLKGEQDLCARDYDRDTTWYPTVKDILPYYYPDRRMEFGQVKSFINVRAQRAWSQPTTRHPLHNSPEPVYNPIHTNIYGNGRRRNL